MLLELTGVGTIDGVGLGAIRRIHDHGGRVAAVAGPATQGPCAARASTALLADSRVAGLRWLHSPGETELEIGVAPTG